MDSVVLQHLSEIIYAVMYSCRRLIDSDGHYFSKITEEWVVLRLLTETVQPYKRSLSKWGWNCWMRC